MSNKPPAPSTAPAGKGGAASKPHGGKDGKGGTGKGRGYGVTDPTSMPTEDRERVLEQIRDMRAIVAAKTRSIRERLEVDPHAKLDSYEAQAILNYEKAISEILASHPGLMELANAVSGVAGSGAVGGSDAARRLRGALGGE